MAAWCGRAHEPKLNGLQIFRGQGPRVVHHADVLSARFAALYLWSNSLPYVGPRADCGAHHAVVVLQENTMKSNRIVCLLAAASLGFGSLSAFAQDYRHGGDNNRDNNRGNNGWNQQQDQRGMGNRGDNERRGNDRRDYSRNDSQDNFYYGARGPEWRRGGRVPQQYRSRQYVVNDWRGHHLSAPPRGYQWVQVGNDYVLTAVATGIIAQLLLNGNQY
jgi:Ni/Co efflux regulator RcnB